MNKVKELLAKIITENKLFWPLTTLVFFLTRIAVWLYPFDSDHWIFYYVGRKWAEGGTMYVSGFDHKPPIIFIYNGLMHFLFGGNLVFHRIFLTAFAILDIYLFYKLLRYILAKLGTKNQLILARIGLIGYVFFRNLSQIASSGNNTENLGLVFFLGMLLLFFMYEEEKKLSFLFYSGLCFSFLFFLKGNFLLLGLPIGILLLVEYYKDFKKLFVTCFAFGLPLILHSAFWLVYFNYKKALYDFFLATFLFSAKYSKVAWSGDLSNNPNLGLSVAFFLIPFIPLFILFLYKIRVKERNTALFLILYLIVSLIITFGVGPAYPYYFLIALPIFVIIAASAQEDFAKLSKFHKAAIIILILLGSAGSYAISLKQVYNSFAGPVKAELDEYKNVAKYVDENSKANDKVFNYDYGATFYRLAERDSGSRFVSASILLLDERDNFGFGFDNLFMKEMSENKAKFVIINKNPNNIYYENAKLINFFNEKYSLDKEFEHYKVLKLK